MGQRLNDFIGDIKKFVVMFEGGICDLAGRFYFLFGDIKYMWL